VVAVVDGEFTVKRLCLKGGRPRLEAENPSAGPPVLPAPAGFQVWGVVVFCIHGVAG
jgi:DNA polymerase V